MKNNYFLYNCKGIARSLVPSVFLPKNREKILCDLAKRQDVDYIKKRVDYYCRLSKHITLDEYAQELQNLRWARKKTVYYFDTYEYAQYFPQHFRAHFAFGDVYFTPAKPSITKSRPIESYAAQQNLQPIILHMQEMTGGEADSIDSIPPFENSTLLNLAKIRHFTFINDPYSFEEKRDVLFYRGGIYQPHRIAFFRQYFHHKMCDLGHTGNKTIHKNWQKPKIGIKGHLPYKFLLSLEGNDVASNLKWVMSSNSLCVMPRPKCETWFMEGTLVPNVHYAAIKDDYSDLEERLNFFIKNPNEAKRIITNAHEYVRQFFDKKREDIISLLVLEKYFYYTGQLETLRI